MSETARTIGRARNGRTVEEPVEGREDVVPKTQPRSVNIASRGIHTAGDAAQFLSALATDVMQENVTEKRANSVCNVVGKLLKVVDMQHRYGSPESQDKALMLSPPEPEGVEAMDRRERELIEELAAIQRERAAK